MHGSPPPPTQPTPTPPTPYRDGKALADIIPPDRRRAKTAALVIASMVTGVVLWVLGGWAFDAIQSARQQDAVPAPTPGYVAGSIGHARLRGPAAEVTLPPPRRAVVHIWLQGCADCMPAFEAMRTIQSEGGLHVDAPIINVAYGEADPTWAQRYGVANNLVFDPGGVNVVRPLGIGTFTTLVVDPDGSIIHRDRPDRPGYAGRVRAAVGFRDPDAVPADPPSGDAMLDQASVQNVVAAHRTAIKRTCWERAADDGPRSVSVNVRMTVGVDGRVTAASASGDDPLVARCIEAQTRTWIFPAAPSPTTVNIPFKFIRE